MDINEMLKEKGPCVPNDYGPEKKLNRSHRHTVVLPSAFIRLITTVYIPKQVSNLRSTQHPLQQSEECSAQDVRAVRFIRSPFFTLLTSTQTANAVRYGTAKGEWFLNAVCNSGTALQLLIPSRYRPLSSHQARSSKPAEDHVNHLQGLTRQSCSSERRVL